MLRPQYATLDDCWLHFGNFHPGKRVLGTKKR